MMRLPAIIALAAGAALVSACASGPSRMPVRQIDRLLTIAPQDAQPSDVVATEFALRKAAREDGAKAAYRAFATSAAQVHTDQGVQAASDAIRSGQAIVGMRDVGAVWMSCDAGHAISRGRIKTAEGETGLYATVWARQADGTYRWSYDIALIDNKERDRERQAETADDTIVVTALDDVQGRVADCPDAENRPEPFNATYTSNQPLESVAATSRDDTLHWQWLREGDDMNRFSSSYWRENAWDEAAGLQFGASARVGTSGK